MKTKAFVVVPERSDNQTHSVKAVYFINFYIVLTFVADHEKYLNGGEYSPVPRGQGYEAKYNNDYYKRKSKAPTRQSSRSTRRITYKEAPPPPSRSYGSHGSLHSSVGGATLLQVMGISLIRLKFFNLQVVSEHEKNLGPSAYLKKKLPPPQKKIGLSPSGYLGPTLVPQKNFWPPSWNL